MIPTVREMVTVFVLSPLVTTPLPLTAREMLPDTGYGFLWRLYSYWKFMAKEDGVIVECRAISLSRDIPLGLGWVIEPIVKNLPRESLINTLKATREALTAGS